MGRMGMGGGGMGKMMGGGGGGMGKMMGGGGGGMGRMMGGGGMGGMGRMGEGGWEEAGADAHTRSRSNIVMAGLVPAIDVFPAFPYFPARA